MPSHFKIIPKMVSNENDTASISSTSTFSSTISLVKKKFTPSPYKSQYPSTDPNYFRWRPKHDLAESAVSYSSNPEASKSQAMSKSDTKENESSRSKEQGDLKHMIFEVGTGVGTTCYSPYQSSYPGPFQSDFPRWGPASDLVDKIVKISERSGDDEDEMDVKEESKKEKRERKKREKERGKAERKKIDAQMVRFPYTAAGMMKP